MADNIDGSTGVRTSAGLANAAKNVGSDVKTQVQDAGGASVTQVENASKGTITMTSNGALPTRIVIVCMAD